MPRKIIFPLLVSLFILQTSNANAALVQWDITGATSATCVSDCVGPMPGPLGGDFVVSTGGGNTSLTSWNVTGSFGWQFLSGAFLNFGGFTTQPGPGIDFFDPGEANLSINIADLGLLSGTSPIPFQANFSGIGFGAPDLDYSGYLVDNAPLPASSLLFAISIACLIFVGVRRQSKTLQRNQ